MTTKTAAALALAFTILARPAAAADITVSPGQSIAAALASAEPGDRVLVEAGTYAEQVTLVNAVELLGGYDASFSDSNRDPQANPTIITGSGSTTPVLAPTVGSATRIDGFVITGAGGDGAAGIVVHGGAPVISNNEIRLNLNAGASGGVYVHGGSVARFENNWIHDNASLGAGGGFRIETSAVTLSGNTIENCSARTVGGGVYVFRSAATLNNNVIRDCTATEGGGGVCLQFVPSGFAMNGGTVEDCTAGFGGGIWLKDEGIATITDVDLNRCSANRGGGIAVLHYCDLGLTDVRFSECTSTIQGGGIYGYQSTIDVLGQDATALPSAASFTDCLSGDGVNGTGGGLSFEFCDGAIERVRFTGCGSDSLGGGLYLLHSGYDIEESVFENCTSIDGGGLAIRASQSSLLRESFVRNCNIYGCTATGPSDATGAPGGGMTLLAMGAFRVATIGGTIISHGSQGAAIRCKRGGSAAQTGSPRIDCSMAQLESGNTADAVVGSRCADAITASALNFQNVDPLYCQSPPTTYTLQDCSPGVNSTCIDSVPGRLNRGAAADGTECTCQTVASVESATWGKIKSMYR
ncbi:MAG: right-handed parallel beta-helix repeat-containing protein [Gemmatimonadetes bacterium]|nr:right-handed parallel beta-helix repeat-containing protein [Gemmatimonadota bacterium]